MKSLLFLFVLLGGAFFPVSAAGHPETQQNDTIQSVPHNWKKSSTDHTKVDAYQHDYTIWDNFQNKTRTCSVSHEIKTVVWYCDLHNHTKSEVSIEETIHSNQHAH